MQTSFLDDDINEDFSKNRDKKIKRLLSIAFALSQQSKYNQEHEYYCTEAAALNIFHKSGVTIWN